jgi:hypothetical protein
MINNIASCGVHAADVAALRQNRAKKSPAAEETTLSGKPTHVPPGLAKAAEKIAAKTFERADADGNGSVTQEELSAVHSKHAQTLAASDLFQSTTTETASTEGEESPETTTTASGISAEQFTEALKKYFYAKVGVIYETRVAPATEQPVPDTSTEVVPDPEPETLSAVA